MFYKTIKILLINIFIFFSLIITIELFTFIFFNKSKLDCTYLMCGQTLNYKINNFENFQDYEVIYKNKGWRGLGHWLGTGNVSNRDKEFPVFEEARELARMSKIRTKEEWGEFSNSSLLHSSIPKAPQHVYKNSGWLGWKDWLGTGQKGCG